MILFTFHPSCLILPPTPGFYYYYYYYFNVFKGRGSTPRSSQGSTPTPTRSVPLAWPGSSRVRLRQAWRSEASVPPPR